MSHESLMSTDLTGKSLISDKLIIQLASEPGVAIPLEEIYREALGDNTDLLTGWKELIRGHVKTARRTLPAGQGIYSIQSHKKYIFLPERLPQGVFFIPINHLNDLKEMVQQHPSLYPFVDFFRQVGVESDVMLKPRLSPTLINMFRELLTAYSADIKRGNIAGTNFDQIFPMDFDQNNKRVSVGKLRRALRKYKSQGPHYYIYTIPKENHHLNQPGFYCLKAG